VSFCFANNFGIPPIFIYSIASAKSMLAPTKAHSPLIFAAATFNFGESSISFADDFSDARANTFPAARG